MMENIKNVPENKTTNQKKYKPGYKRDVEDRYSSGFFLSLPSELIHCTRKLKE